MEKTLHKHIAFACALFINLLLWYVIFSFYQQFKTSPVLIDPFKNKQEPVVSFQQQATPTAQPISQQKTIPVQQMVHEQKKIAPKQSEPITPSPSPTKNITTRQRQSAQQDSQQQAESQSNNQEEQSGTHHVTREQFSQALQNALQAPAEPERNHWGNTTAAGESNLPYYIQTRIRAEQHLSYDSKVNQVLKSTFAIARQPIICNAAVNKPITISISIDRLGRPVDVRLLEGTTMPVCDAYLVNTIKGCTFAPLPARFIGDTYQFIHSAQFQSQAGTNVFEYFYSLFD